MSNVDGRLLNKCTKGGSVCSFTSHLTSTSPWFPRNLGLFTLCARGRQSIDQLYREDTLYWLISFAPNTGDDTSKEVPNASSALAGDFVFLRACNSCRNFVCRLVGRTVLNRCC